MTLEEILRVPTAASPEERADDVWDDENRCCYSADGEKLLDFAFQDYMAEDRKIGEEIPLDERDSFLEKIHLPASLTHIGNAAFNECGFLESIRLPKGLLSIGEEAFCDCWNLEKVTCPASLRVIGPRAFQGCINLYQIRLNKGLEAIGEDAFDDCESLEAILVPAGTLDRFLTLLPKSLHEFIEEL